MSCGSSFRFVGAEDAIFVGCQAEVSSRHNLNNLDLPPFCQCKKRIFVSGLECGAHRPLWSSHGIVGDQEKQFSHCLQEPLGQQQFLW